MGDGYSELQLRCARLEDQLNELQDETDETIGELKEENAELKAQLNELRAQLEAKEEFATAYPQVEERNGLAWQRTVTVIAPEWEQA